MTEANAQEIRNVLNEKEEVVMKAVDDLQKRIADICSKMQRALSLYAVQRNERFLRVTIIDAKKMQSELLGDGIQMKEFTDLVSFFEDEYLKAVNGEKQ